MVVLPPAIFGHKLPSVRRKLVRPLKVRPDPAPGPAPEKESMIKFKVNVLAPQEGSRLACFIAAGEPSPWRSADEVPDRLRGFITKLSEVGPKPDDSTPSATFTLGETYNVDEHGFRRPKNIQRENYPA